MGKVVILGTAGAVPTETHENTHFIIEEGDRVVLVDCPGNPTARLAKAGVQLGNITDVILTHFHPDHVSGFALLLMDMWLTGRKNELNVYGLEYTIQRAQVLMELFDRQSWPDFLTVNYRILPEEKYTTLLSSPEFTIVSSPVQHMIPTIGLRIEFNQTGRVLAYSCDTAPCAAVVELSRGANYLLHEASGKTFGHTSAGQAGEIAQKAGVDTLYLIHYYPNGDVIGMLDEARAIFGPKVFLAEDWLQLNL